MFISKVISSWTLMHALKNVFILFYFYTPGLERGFYVACVAGSPGKGRGNWSERAGGEGLAPVPPPLPFPGEPATQARFYGTCSNL